MYVCKYEKMTKKLVTLNISDQVYEDFKKNIVGKKVSNVIEDFMKSVNDEKAKEKKSNSTGQERY
jgi:oligoribonuclease NrnB/cAMP/cGMP phosphodiesterase (DHH superfamily)